MKRIVIADAGPLLDLARVNQSILNFSPSGGSMILFSYLRIVKGCDI